ncbi:mitochondria fission 1 protein [Gonapodya prolifera JEL478]|uniref:Mitochondrial fission 1 protein n=1 Tax=Gonapodya prolifera (strain JEL478) TaxID=1344416 RepID=A0A139A4T8_GONPJ|nr:mitochondria fission 1 protein [Gonapodya prolifera JEL478]|eukprot:KXS11638.1 mitochondria fission 1 protein [Gonapodya prolifera JEL478]
MCWLPIQVIREQYQRERPAPSVQTTFNYAWGLVRSGNKQDIEEGMKVLWGLYKNQPHLSRECLFYLCIGHLKLGNYSDARKYIVALLKEEPSNTQFEALKDLIDQRVQEEGLTGMAIVGGAAAVS